MNLEDESLSGHWADTAARSLVEAHPNQKQFVCASGISPSGVVHIGNFREVITVDFVARALRTQTEDRGAKVRFLYSWDDFDALRKVPVNIPNQDALKSQLRKALREIPDPLGEYRSYAERFERMFEAEIATLGIQPEFIYQAEAYRKCTYVEGIKKALENQAAIRALLDTARTENLPEDWWCVTVYSEFDEKDETKILEYKPPYTIRYFCRNAKKEFTTDFSKEGRVKLLWRVDWPMRWAHEKVDFEPGGKDHSSTGGSYDTGKEIVRKIWKREPPHYVQYDFVLAKGLGSKLSSSTGNLITLSEALQVYEPQVIRWIFASRKPNLDFTIAFDLDVMKAYDDYDRCERFAFDAEEGEPRKVSFERRIYEMSSLTYPVEYPEHLKGKGPVQFQFRHLCNILQICEGDLEKTIEHWGQDALEHRDRFLSRAKRAWKWITEYAPETFRFSIRKDSDKPDPTAFPGPVSEIVELLSQPQTASMTEEALANAIYEVMQKAGLNAKTFFPEIYRILIGKSNGPKLASFIQTIGLPRAVRHLRSALP